jgi:Gamma-glutamyl phosphate reductase
LTPKVSGKSVKNVNEAINHIKTFGTNHTECKFLQPKVILINF